MGVARLRVVRITAGALAVGVTAGAIVSAGGGTAGAASLPQAQSVGNFLDATVGGMLLDPVVKLDYATASSPGSQSVQNPLSAKVLNTGTVPLTGDLQLPELAGIKLGAVNQVAVAKSNGASYGASGAVSNSGAVSVGGSNSAYPAGATIHLSPSTLSGNSPIAIPGLGTAANALGSVSATIGGVGALAKTPKGYGDTGRTNYRIADVSLSIGSPLLGQVLTSASGQLNGALSPVVTALSGLLGAANLPKACTFSASGFGSISLEGGAITVNATHARITISLEKLLKQLGLKLNALPANTDLLSYLLNYLTSPSGLTKAVVSAINGLLDPLQNKLSDCATAITGSSPIAALLKQLIGALKTGKATLESTATTLVGDLTGTAGVSPLAPIGTALKQLLDIGVNVQPHGTKGTFKSALAATPKQGTPVVRHQIVVRAIELDVAPAGNSVAAIALGNAAAGPSAAPVVITPTPTPTTIVPTTLITTTAVPTGVPAGAAGHGGGSPVLPIVLLLLGLTVAGGGVLSYRMRGGFRH
jgi:hypothetical protein